MIKPNPGSDAAIKAGCTCAVLDNCHGRGYRMQPGVYVYTEGCPVHRITLSTSTGQSKEEHSETEQTTDSSA